MALLNHNVTDRFSPNPQTMLHLGNAYQNETGTVFRIEAITYDGRPSGPYNPPVEVLFIRIRDSKPFRRPGADVRIQIETEKLVLVPEHCLVEYATQTTKGKGFLTIEIVHQNSENQ